MTTMSSYTQFGYPYTSASQLLMSTGSATSGGAGPSAGVVGAASPGGGGGSSGGAGSAGSGATSPCCDSGRPLVTDPVTGQTVCSCQYDRLQALSAYGPSAAAAAAARLAAVSSAVTGVSGVGLHGVYSAAYPSTEQNPYPSLGMDSTAFYSSLANPYSLKEGAPTSDVTAWSGPGLQTAPGYYPYDPALAAYGYGASYDLAARRKNATRESTATLKAWLSEHKKNPYPTKGEKIMLAIITKMTLTQVSTWFANARRRLKKENKMTWEPKNRNDDDDDDDCSTHSDDEGKSDKEKHIKDGRHDDHHDKDGDHGDKSDCEDDSRGSMSPHSVGSNSCVQPNGDVSVSVSVSNLNPCQVTSSSSSSDNSVVGNVKPKIWSLADTAACKTPPPPSVNIVPSAAHSWFSGVNPVNPMASMSAMGSMASVTGSGSMMNGMANMSNMATMGKIGAGFGAYARYPGLPGYGGGYAGATGSAYGLASVNNGSTPYSDVQTDTPPQTPPNLKVSSMTPGLLGHQYVSPSGLSSSSATIPNLNRPSTVNMANNNPAEQTEMLSPISRNPSMSVMTSNAANLTDPSSTAFRPVYRASPVSGGYVTSS